MVKSVYVPEAGGIIDFADDITPQEISSYISRKYPSVTAPAAAPEPSYDNSGVLGRFAYGLGTGISDVPGGIASLLYTAEEAKKTSAGQFSEEARKYLQETFGIDPTKDPTTAQWLAETLGSAASFLVPGGAAAKGVSLVGKGAALAGRAGAVTAGAQGVALGAGSRAQTIEQQLASGMEISPEQQLASQRLSGLIGASEALPMQKFFGPLTTLLSKVPASKSGVVEQIIQSRLAKVTKAGAQEAAQEVASGIANDLMEYGVYNPDVELGQDILSNAGGGAFAGSVIEGVIQLAAGRKLRGARQLQADIEKEKQANSADLQRANVAVAADELTKSGVEGTLSVEANEAPDGSIRHTVMSPDNKPLVDLPTADDAVQAINLYKQKTGKEVAASVKEAPALNPVRVGNKSFPTVEAAISEHERLKKEVTNLEWRVNNPKEIEDIAKQRNIPAQALFKQHVDTLEDRRKALSMFDTYFSPEPVAPVEPQAKLEIATPEAVASVAAPVATPEPIAEPVAPAESKPEEYDKSFSKPEPEETLTPITSEEEVPEMPIGAVELPIEESRILPDTIVEDEFIPEPGIEPAPVRIEKRPDATVDDLANLQTELFGQPINVREMTPEQKAIYEAERDKRFPPKETDVYYAGGPLREPAPKNLREANITGPMVKDYSPETQAWIKSVYTQLQSRLQSIIPDKASIELKTLVDAPAGYLVRGQVRSEKAPDGMKSIIDLSTGILEPGMSVEDAVKKLSEILNHEVIHVLRNKGVIRPAEWRILTRAAQNTKVPGKKYTYFDKAESVYTPNGQPISEAYADPDAVIEEAVAEMYREWVVNRNKPKEQNAIGILNRIAEFFRRIFQTLRNARHEEFFKKIEAGEVGRREGDVTAREAMLSATPTPVPTATELPESAEATAEQAPQGGTRLSAAPLPQYVQQQNETLFTPAPKVSFRDMLFNYIFGPGGTEKTVTVNGVTVPVSKKAVAGKVAAVDNAAYVAELEKIANQQATGNYQRQQADYSATAALSWLRRSSHIMASMMLRGNLSLNYDRPGDILSATMKVTDDPDNLKEVFKVMTEPGPDGPNGEKTTKADIFKTYAVAKRGEWLRATGQTVPRELTPQYIAQTIPFVEREYPEVVEAYKKYQRFNKKLMTTARDAGLISTAELGRLTNQMNYYGFIYEVYGEPLGPSTGQKAASRFKLRPYTGTQRGGLVNDPMFVMIQNAQFLVTSVAKNLAVTKSFELAKTMGEARLLQTDEKPDELRGEQPDVMFYSKDGVVQRFAVKDPLMVTALGSDDRINVGRFWEILGLPTHVLRESVTRDPGFMARNLLRDTLSAWITSGANFTPVVGTLKNFALAVKSGGSFNALAARGVVGSYDLAMQTPEELSATFRQNLMPKNVHTFTSVQGAAALGRSLWNRLGTISEASDAATRMAVYDACIAQGMSEAEAAMQAIELLDFTRRGASQTLGILTKLIPFLNARIQGLDVLYQAGRAGIRYATGRSLGERDANIGKKFLIRGGMLAAISMLLEYMNQDDEDYKQLDNYIKEGNLLIPLRDFGLPGQFIAFPKPFEAGLLFSTLPQQIVKGINGDASLRENADLFWGSIGSTFGVNPIPQALLPPIEIITNHNFFTGLPLISEGKARLAPELQYNTSTSQLAMMIGGLPIFYDFTTGKFGGASPIVIDKIISGYGGPIGTYLVQAVSLGMQDAEIGPERMPIELSNAPVVKSFFIEAKSKNPKVVTQAYELFRIADEANRTVSRLKQMQDAEALTAYIDENRGILRYKKYIFTLADRLNKLSAQERAIERDTTMTADEKIAAQRELRDVRIRLASKVEEINRQLGR